VLLLMATIYVGSGPVMKLVHVVRRLLPSRVSPAQPAHGNIKS
jgi:hypothetical protein